MEEEVKWITKNGKHIPITNIFMNKLIRGKKDVLSDREILEQNNIEEKDKLIKKRDEILQNEDIKRSFMRYTNDSDYINKEAKNNNIYNDDIINIDKAISMSYNEKPILLFRGEQRTIDKYKDLKVGDEISMSTYLSTSFKKDTAEFYRAYDYNKNYYETLFEIKTPAKTNLIYLGDASSYDTEEEVLLGRNNKYKVLSIKDEQYDKMYFVAMDKIERKQKYKHIILEIANEK